MENVTRDTKNDLDELKDQLDETFNTEEKRFLARQKLQEVIQGPKESVAEFSERVDKLVVKGHDGLDGAERPDRIACESFVKGLRADIKEPVWENALHLFKRQFEQQSDVKVSSALLGDAPELMKCLMI